MKFDPLFLHLKQSVHRTATTKAGHFMTRVGITATRSIAERRPYRIV